MTQSLTKVVSFDEFIECLPERSEMRYELHDGIIIEMPKPTGKHSNVTGFLMEALILSIIQMGKRGIWTIPRESIIKPNNISGYEPDIIILNQETLSSEPRWERESIILNCISVKLIVEVVSGNWRNDYHKKYADFEQMGIPEYWIIDYAALGSREFIGNPKQPTISVCILEEGEYNVNRFRGNDLILSPTFPVLNLTAQQIFDSGL